MVANLLRTAPLPIAAACLLGGIGLIATGVLPLAVFGVVLIFLGAATPFAGAAVASPPQPSATQQPEPRPQAPLPDVDRLFHLIDQRKIRGGGRVEGEAMVEDVAIAEALDRWRSAGEIARSPHAITGQASYLIRGLVEAKRIAQEQRAGVRLEKDIEILYFTVAGAGGEPERRFIQVNTADGSELRVLVDSDAARRAADLANTAARIVEEPGFGAAAAPEASR